jgi:hypothetical protein
MSSGRERREDGVRALGKLVWLDEIVMMHGDRV